MDTWIITDSMGEYIEYYNATNHIMVFTRERDKAMVTTDSEYAFELARLARELYKRKNMRIAMV